ncbi:hypothetical protein K439DRAFT_1511100 [Ramaria rubella]|nr:hypothetical protein K439DRAFT_1511100 [Ramaria rubella]
MSGIYCTIIEQPCATWSEATSLAPYFYSSTRLYQCWTVARSSKREPDLSGFADGQQGHTVYEVGVLLASVYVELRPCMAACLHMGKLQFGIKGPLGIESEHHTGLGFVTVGFQGYQYSCQCHQHKHPDSDMLHSATDVSVLLSVIEYAGIDLNTATLNYIMLSLVLSQSWHDTAHGWVQEWVAWGTMNSFKQHEADWTSMFSIIFAQFYAYSAR